MTSALTLFGSIFFALFASAEHQKWGKIQKDNSSSQEINNIELKLNQDQKY